MDHYRNAGRSHATARYRADRCPECRHAGDDYGISHFPDCRYFWTEENAEDEADAAFERLRAPLMAVIAEGRKPGEHARQTVQEETPSFSFTVL